MALLWKRNPLTAQFGHCIPYIYIMYVSFAKIKTLKVICLDNIWSSFLYHFIAIEQKDSSDNSVHHCEVCNKTFSRSSLLKQHSVIHMGNKRFKFRCEVCGKMFRTRSHLRDHMRIHTGMFHDLAYYQYLFSIFIFIFGFFISPLVLMTWIHE